MCPVLNKQIMAAVIVPLRLDERPVGAIWMGRYSPASFTPADLIGLERLADQAVIALEHAMMAGRLQSLAVMEERSRIAREMHDSLAQILGYLSLQTQTLEALVKQGDQNIVLCELKRARDSIRAAQDDVRESILSLRTTLSGNFGLILALRHYVEEFGVQTGIRAVLIDETKPWLALSPLAETQLVRIVQEALTNVRKHAQARQVEVRMIVPNSVLHVIVTDDGIGFQDDAVEGSHFGLQTMRERAESIGGSLLVSSIVGEGTQVEFRLPLVNN